jgi:hypothetical protein
MTRPRPLVSLRFYWLLPPGSFYMTWKLEGEKALVCLYLTYLVKLSGYFLNPFPVSSTWSLGTWPNPSHQTSTPPLLAKAIWCQARIPHFTFIAPKSSTFSSPPFTAIFYFLFFLFYIIPVTDISRPPRLLVAKQKGRGQSGFVLCWGRHYCRLLEISHPLF